MLLPTALISIEAPTGRCVQARALVDPASDTSLASLQLIRKVGLPMKEANVTIGAVGGYSAALATRSATIRIILSEPLREILDVPLLILRHINVRTPSEKISERRWNHLKNIPLANPAFTSPMDIQVILGADVYGSIILDGVRQGYHGDPVAQRTRLGWTVTGTVQSCGGSTSAPLRRQALCSRIQENADVSIALQKFWELEELPHESPRSPDELECELLYKKGYQRLPNGRYSVKLPFKSTVTPQQLGDTLQPAMHALEGNLARMKSNLELKEEYEQFMKEYEDLGHMRALGHVHDQPESLCYLTHHGIWQPGDRKRKLRVVFNASRHSHDHSSLNELLHAGPALQNDLSTILLRWRFHRIVICADIRMMYRQILVDPADLDFQRIVWKRPQEHQVAHFQLLTLTYGMSCAPYLAIRTLKQLAEDEGARYPEAARVLLNDAYVDDILTGAPDLTSARILQVQLIQMLKSGGFHLRKWVSNHEHLLQDLPEEDRLRP